MYNGNHAAPRRQRKGGRTALLVLCLILACTIAVGGTVAWLVDSTPAVTNTMTPGNVPISIQETVENNIKSSVKIQNNGNIDAYIRVAVVANAVDAEGHIIAGDAPDFAVDPENWTALGGYYYYKGVVAPGGTTPALFRDGVDFANGEVNILAESIQVLGGYNGQKPETYAWGVTYDSATQTWAQA